MVLNQIVASINSMKSSAASKTFVHYVREITTRLNGGKEVEVSESVQVYATYALVIVLGFITTTGLRSFLIYALGLSDEPRKGVPTKVAIEFQKATYEMEFTKDDFSNEISPKDGVTVLQFKYMIAKLLTPKIYESKNKAAALATTVISPANFLLTLKGEELDEDEKTLFAYGVKNDDKILVTLATHKPAQDDDDDDQSEDGDDDSDGTPNRKRIRNRAKKAKKAKKGAKQKKKQAPAGEPKEYGDFPEPVVTPLTPSEEVDKVMAELEAEVLPLIEEFIQNGPNDKVAREDEHHRLSELVLLKMFMMDGIDAAEPDVRQQRKEAINKMHQHLSALDKAKNAAA